MRPGPNTFPRSVRSRSTYTRTELLSCRRITARSDCASPGRFLSSASDVDRSWNGGRKPRRPKRGSLMRAAGDKSGGKKRSANRIAERPPSIRQGGDLHRRRKGAGAFRVACEEERRQRGGVHRSWDFCAAFRATREDAPGMHTKNSSTTGSSYCVWPSSCPDSMPSCRHLREPKESPPQPSSHWMPSAALFGPASLWGSDIYFPGNWKSRRAGPNTLELPSPL